MRVLRRGFAACGRRVTFWTARKSPKNRRGTAQDEHEVLIFALPIPSGLRPSPLDKGSRPPVPRYRGRQLGDLGGYRKGAGSSADRFSLVFRCRSLGKGRELGTPLMESAFVAVGLKCGSGERHILKHFLISVGAAHWAARGFWALHMFLQPCRGDPRGRPSEPYRFSTNFPGLGRRGPLASRWGVCIPRKHPHPSGLRPDTFPL